MLSEQKIVRFPLLSIQAIISSNFFRNVLRKNLFCFWFLVFLNLKNLIALVGDNALKSCDNTYLSKNWLLNQNDEIQDKEF